MTVRSCREAWAHMTEISMETPVRNFTQILDMSSYVVETDLFPIKVLNAYSAWNLEQALTAGEREYFNEERGGGQGDYREGMANKIANVVSCLNEFPDSKRAVITIPNEPFASHADDDNAKCMREIHFHLEGTGHGDSAVLNASVLFRAQAASIFPKNIHFIGSLMDTIAAQLDAQPLVGTLHYLATILVNDRN